MRQSFAVTGLSLLLACTAFAQGNAGLAIVGWWRVAGGGNLYASEDGKVIHELEEEEIDGTWTNLGGRSYRLAFHDGSGGVVTLTPDGGKLEGSTRASRFTVGSARPREPLSNASIMDMVKAGIHESVILNLIQRHIAAYSFGRDELAALKSCGVSANIVAAMWKRKNWASALTDTALPAMLKDGLSDEISAAAILQFSGVYSLLPEDLASLRQQGVSEKLIAALHAKLNVPVEFQAGVNVRGGAALPAESVQWDSLVSGRIAGAHAAEAVKIPPGCARLGLICDMKIPPTEFLIHAASDREAGGFQLARLRVIQDHREFHDHDGVQMDVRLIADSTYLVSFSISTSAPSGMGPGEYGFLSPDGKVAYTFRLIE